MPGLLRGVARTAVIAGTASAVNGRVQRRQAERFAERDAHIAAERQAAYQQEAYAQPQQQYAQPQQYQQPPAAAPAPAGGDTIQQLKDLADLKAQGILTDEEFAAQKARILG
ncbi:putative oligomerization/nucleic acid binding protein [Mumia flava]|uniref:Putative oligomerization/nucleic acid binding protein n=1 Tax=Mumia flava TaxID=1348852 RepID=A0A0B2B3C3_9ACTN|nr:SHOCT domain-containing protein [Mumia flava]PJJ56743.1 putative oligomerization/nucleic acid binding protein [Mumia flava]